MAEVELVLDNTQKEDRWFAVRVIKSAPTARELRRALRDESQGFDVVLRGRKYAKKTQTRVTF